MQEQHDGKHHAFAGTHSPALLLLRSVLAVSTLLASGRTLWLLPNLMSEASARLHCLVGCMCLPARLPGMAGL